MKVHQEDVTYEIAAFEAAITGVPITLMGAQLWRDIFIAATITVPIGKGIGPFVGLMDKVLTDAVANARNTTEPGDIGYPIWEAELEIGGENKTIWIEQFSDRAASIYYPSER